MKITRLTIENFRGIRQADLTFPDHAVLIGDNNTGKSTILEAMDLVLGPDRLNRQPPIDEHDFFQGKYLKPTPAAPAAVENPEEAALLAELGLADPPPPTVPAPKIRIEATIANLSEMQIGKFGDFIEWLDVSTNDLYTDPDPGGVDKASIISAVRVTFIGYYDEELDDFAGNTYFSRSLEEDGEEEAHPFTKKDKQKCGFLYLRSVRTGARALSLEHGSLLDIILRLKELRPRMWEDTIGQLGALEVASAPELGISGVLQSIESALKKYVPREWGVNPHLKVSSLTREHLRKVITAFIATGEGEHAAPFYRQGTGTINMLVLAMLSQIAADKQNVIFAMEEVETAIPPYAQKRIVHELRKLAAQSLVTSHSPYVLEVFAIDETIHLSRTSAGDLSQAAITLPDSVKHKRYRQEFRTRFCEAMLSRRILIAEGATEAASMPVVARRLSELNPTTYASLEALGLTVLDAGTETQIADLAGLYRGLGKRVFAVCDKQSAESKAAIEAQVDDLFMHEEKGFEDLVLKNTTAGALARFAGAIDWPAHLLEKFPDPAADAANAVKEYFLKSKGNWAVADFLAQCQEDEIPDWLKDVCVRLKDICDPPAPAADEVAAEPAPDDGAALVEVE